MLKLKYDVVVVGGGPAGCIAAKYAAKSGASTLLLEEHSEIGEPVQCAGLLSRRAVEESELRETKTFVNCELKGAVLYPPSHALTHALTHALAPAPSSAHASAHELRIESPPSSGKRAFAVSRSAFDKELARAAQKAGAEIILKTKVKAVKKKAGEAGKAGLTVSTAGEGEIGARVVVGADGVRSVVAKTAGAGREVTKNFLTCVQIEGKYEVDEPFAEIFVGRTVAPGFFAWAIPLGESSGTARIGLCIDRRFSPSPSPLPFLKKLLSNHPVVAKKFNGTRLNLTRLNLTAGRIPLALPRPQTTVKTVKDGGAGVLLVGDAAAQVKPVTGGGVYYGLKCGKIAGQTAAKACLSGDAEVLREYEERWQKEIGQEIAFGLKIHRLRCVLSDRDFNALCKAVSKYDLTRLLTDYGDIDYPSLAFREVLKNPGIIKLMAKNVIKYLYAK